MIYYYSTALTFHPSFNSAIQSIILLRSSISRFCCLHSNLLGLRICLDADFQAYVCQYNMLVFQNPGLGVFYMNQLDHSYHRGTLAKYQPTKLYSQQIVYPILTTLTDPPLDGSIYHLTPQKISKRFLNVFLSYWI